MTQLPEDAVLDEPAFLSLPAEPLASLQERALLSRDDYASARLSEKAAKEQVTITRDKVAITSQDAKIGWKLVGRDGLGCVACHAPTDRPPDMPQDVFERA